MVETATTLEGRLGSLDRPRALARVAAVREAAAGALGEWSHARFKASRAAVDRLLDAGRFTEAVSVAERLVKEGLAAGEQAYPGAPYDLALSYAVLGQALQRSGVASASLEPLEEARRRFQELADAGDRDAARMVAMTLTEVGDSLTALGRLDEAAGAYKASIRRAEEMEDPRQSAVARGQLGTVRVLQAEYAEALGVYQEAREVFEKLSEPGSVAAAWHQIGWVHQEAGDYDAAEDAHRRSLRIKVERGDRWGEATTLNQLGNLAGRRDRPEEAVRLYRQAAEVFVELDDRANEGRARNNAGYELLKLRRYNEARRELERAVECKAPYGHAAEPWKTLNLLHDLEQATDNEEAATVARERAVQAYLAYRRDGGENHSPTGKLAAPVHAALTQGEPQTAKKLATDLARLLENPDLPDRARPFIQALQALLAGSRDPALAADPALDYDDAAELLLLLERLE